MKRVIFEKKFISSFNDEYVMIERHCKIFTDNRISGFIYYSTLNGTWIVQCNSGKYFYKDTKLKNVCDDFNVDLYRLESDNTLTFIPTLHCEHISIDEITDNDSFLVRTSTDEFVGFVYKIFKFPTWIFRNEKECFVNRFENITALIETFPNYNFFLIQ
jgi:hypothetical protein